jgi:hypothetical protein
MSAQFQNKAQDGGRSYESLVLDLGLVAAQTASGNGASQDMGAKGSARLTLDVTAASGTTPTLDVTLQTSEDALTWRTLGTFAQKTIVSAERKSFGGADRYVRALWVIAGTTPSFTFTVRGEGV